jgi:glycosyltransferase involved in cell wall biosynthesis
MKVLLFTNQFPSIHEPTRGVFNLRRFRALAKYCDVRVVVPVPQWKRLKRPSEFIRSPSNYYEGLWTSYPTNWAAPKVLPQLHAHEMYFSVRSHVREVWRRFPFDVVLGAFGYPDAVAASWFAKDFDCSFVALVMGSDINDLAQRAALRPGITEALTEASGVVALSMALKERVVQLGIPEDRVVVQHNGVDGARFVIRDRELARNELAIKPKGKLGCFIGNLVHEKGPDILIEALARIDADQTPVEIVFVGDGQLSADLELKARQAGVGNRVRFVGRCLPERIATWIAASDLLCLPSRREGCPNVVLEALACGRPVVASRVGGVPELVSDRNGIVVRSGDPVAFATAMEAALRREWDSHVLRATVPSLSWDDFGRSVYTLLVRATQETTPDLRRVG